MEVELKYMLDSQVKGERIFEDEYVRSIMDKNSEEFIHMEAVYFDTVERRLNREGIIFRVRRENSKIIATLKWNGVNEEGMYKREEINVPLTDPSKLRTPDVDIFAQSPMCQKLKDIVGQKQLVPVMDMEFDRKQVRLDTGVAICELSVDYGQIKCGGKVGKISELEIELYSGKVEALEEIGRKISEKYFLTPGVKSKFKQGIDLIK